MTDSPILGAVRDVSSRGVVTPADTYTIDGARDEGGMSPLNGTTYAHNTGNTQVTHRITGAGDTPLRQGQRFAGAIRPLGVDVDSSMDGVRASRAGR